ncbi:MAG: J domain-containing protein [Ruminococcaceae bacterium]|nr:J domain-containing protein [Oscillospiraceae bacterium]
MIDDPYKVLGVSPNASDDEIKQAYRRLAKQYHPDRNPGDETAAKKMQQVNAAYEQIKNPEKAQPRPGGYQSSYSQEPQGDAYQRSAYNYIRYGRYREALNVLQNCTERNARWYYLSALANNGLGNQVTALEHIKRAVSMEPDNLTYQQLLNHMEYGGTTYRQHAGNYRGFTARSNPCFDLCLCLFLQWLCPCC